jgi:type II secretory pathway pseudopilin PulG
MYLLQLTPKTSLRRQLNRLHSFTLVELLVVIGIIALLAAILLPTANWAIKAAKRVQASNTATQIQTAAMAYFTEYGIYPVPYGAAAGDYLLTDATANKATWGTLICTLCGNLQPSNPLSTYTPTTITNARGVAFLNMKASDVDSGNAPLNPLPPSTSGTSPNPYFNIAMDYDYDSIIGTNSVTKNNVPNFALSSQSSINWTGTSTAGAIVWANCSGNTSNTNNANYWVHTF